MLKTLNQKVSLVLFAIALLYLIYAYQIPSFPYTVVDADVIPKVLGYLLLILSVFLFFIKDEESEEQKARRNIPKKEVGMLLGVGGLIILYIIFLEILGFVFVTALFIFLCSRFLGYKNYLANVLVSIILPVSLYLMFTQLLRISLPSGILPF
ncbi:tripartite tricarboxylate transporter TctB family protein [Oceanobacillus luteolus]|uniref:Tripartite tricarboxylate transporter TctB family protein n=1 Tax=Oceanobacillus luteolus TaxID=1274358 RepID=A0ABW4HWD5_9BACI|nr:tripartite tricarboxylate transporter TctB family protein [Oceanobacillus luteolus]MCM3740885.1 tripartite tricarboxylate transporter TctB family protein [Oceanobacillus luteolus]